MAREEHTSRCSNSSSGGAGGGSSGGVGSSSHRSSKKLKHKKVPQRGMGVAQLEKIRLEQDQKKDVNDVTPNSGNSCTNLASMQTVPSFRPSSCSIPLPPPLPPNHRSLFSKTDGGVSIISGSGSGSFSKPTTGGGGSNWSRLLSDGEYSFEGEKQNQKHNQNLGVDQYSRYTAAAYPTNIGGLHCESSPPVWPPLSNLMLQRSQSLQLPCSSSLVNVPAGTSSSPSSSAINFQMEPPSNQSYDSNNYQPLWPEEEKMVGMKRPYPFSLEHVPIPSFNCKFPSTFVSPISRLDESASCSNGSTTSIEPAYPTFRENPSSSVVIPNTITKKSIDENQLLTRDFLKLGPPQASQLNSSSNEKLQISPCITEQAHFEMLPTHNGQSKDAHHLSGIGGSNPQPYLSFFPAARAPIRQPGSSSGDAGESVDLNLKL
uniref:uncharacterized protein LOC122597526 n=1 Tax=Erigeron canadensis TaxID=72917 RepID=UPI001CB926EA|nr:uncharacterized protein LOC122597526 [Erigeron canadensis]